MDRVPKISPYRILRIAGLVADWETAKHGEANDLQNNHGRPRQGCCFRVPIRPEESVRHGQETRLVGILVATNALLGLSMLPLFVQ
jgi:hypothetical protein